MSRSRLLSSIFVPGFTSGIKEAEHEMLVFQLVNFVAARMFSTGIRRRDVPSSTLKTQVREPREVSPWVIGAAYSKTRPVPAVAVTSSSVHIAMYTVNESWEEVKRRQGREDESGGV